jgi:prophage maintenance system killer protein
VAINHRVRHADEWFDEPDELDRVQRVLASIDSEDDPFIAAALLAARLTRAQAFSEANKRTALLVARWILDRNGLDGAVFIPANDLGLADLLVKAAAGEDVEAEIVEYFDRRR